MAKNDIFMRKPDETPRKRFHFHHRSNSSHPFTFELFLPGCRGSWEEAGSRGSAGWSAS